MARERVRVKRGREGKAEYREVVDVGVLEGGGSMRQRHTKVFQPPMFIAQQMHSRQEPGPPAGGVLERVLSSPSRERERGRNGL
jgi:hypothetical protein